MLVFRRLMILPLALAGACGDRAPLDAAVSVDFGPPPDLTPRPFCNDQVKNGQESDVDCGGPTCARCQDQRACSRKEDCLSWVCTSGRCVGGKAPVMSFRRGQFIPLEGARGQWRLTHDINHDGRLDLLAGNSVTCAFWVVPGIGDGTFGKPICYGTGGPIIGGAVLADLDQDGELDLATVLHKTAEVLWFRGARNGSFKEAARIKTLLDTAGDITAVDYDRNGRVDLVLGGGSTNIGLLAGLRDGGFDARWILHPEPLGMVDSRDLDGDGLPEIIAGSRSGLAIFSPDRRGHFRTPPGTLVVPGTEGPEALYLADLNRDGRTDVLGFVFDRPGFATSLGDGSGLGLGPFFFVRVFPTLGDAAITDFDGDNTVDLALHPIDQEAKQVHLYSGSGDGWGPSAFHRALVLDGLAPWGLLAADFNRDGLPDLAADAVSAGVDGLQILINTSR